MDAVVYVGGTFEVAYKGARRPVVHLTARVESVGSVTRQLRLDSRGAPGGPSVIPLEIVREQFADGAAAEALAEMERLILAMREGQRHRCTVTVRLPEADLGNDAAGVIALRRALAAVGLRCPGNPHLAWTPAEQVHQDDGPTQCMVAIDAYSDVPDVSP